MRGNDDAAEARSASESEQILAEVEQNSTEQHQSREIAGDIRRGWLREFQGSAGIRRAAGWSRRLDQSSAALESVIGSDMALGEFSWKQLNFNFASSLVIHIRSHRIYNF